MEEDFNTSQLRVFRVVATSGSFTAAAARLGISQSAVSQHIARLERTLGARLMDRSGGALRITRAGQVVLRLADSLMVQLHQVLRELSALSDPTGGELQLAAYPSASAALVPPVVAALRTTAPQVRVRVIEAEPAEALPRLLRGDVDLAVVYDYRRPDREIPTDGRLLYEPLACDPMAVAVPAGHPLARLPRIPLAALGREPWAAPAPGMCRRALLEACRDSGFEPAVVYETDNCHGMLGLVASATAVAVVDRLTAAAGIPQCVTLRPLSHSWLRRTPSVVLRAGTDRSPLRDRVRAILRRITADLMSRPLSPYPTPRPPDPREPADGAVVAPPR